MPSFYPLFIILDLSCLSCHAKSPPYYGCDRENTTQLEIDNGVGFGSDLYNIRGQDVVHKCVLCAIEDTWSLKTRDYVGQRRKLCLATGHDPPLGCSFFYPVGTEWVIQFCRCNTNLCNLGDITTINGSHAHIDDFPKRDALPGSEKDSGNTLQVASMSYILSWTAALIVVRVIFSQIIS